MSINFELEDIDDLNLSLSLKSGSELPEGLSLSPTGFASSGHSLSGTPSISANPSGSFTEYNFTLILTDESGGSVEQTFSIRIYKENQAPVFEFEGSVITEINLEFRKTLRPKIGMMPYLPLLLVIRMAIISFFP